MTFYLECDGSKASMKKLFALIFSMFSIVVYLELGCGSDKRQNMGIESAWPLFDDEVFHFCRAYSPKVLKHLVKSLDNPSAVRTKAVWSVFE